MSLAAVIAHLRRAPASADARAKAYAEIRSRCDAPAGSDLEEMLDAAAIETFLGLCQRADSGVLDPDDHAEVGLVEEELSRRLRTMTRKERRHARARQDFRDHAEARRKSSFAAAAGSSAPTSCPLEEAPVLLDRLMRDAVAMRHQHGTDLEFAWRVCLAKHQDGIGFADAALRLDPALSPLREADPRTLANRVSQQQKRLRDALRATAATAGVLGRQDPPLSVVDALIDRLGRCPDRRRVRGYGRDEEC
jgi:hypothetical protein